jgi:hypothetical protein
MLTHTGKTNRIADTERALAAAGCPGSDLHGVPEDDTTAGAAFAETWLTNALQFAFGSATVAVIESHGTTEWQ